MEERPLSTIEKAAARLATLKPEPASARAEKIAKDPEPVVDPRDAASEAVEPSPPSTEAFPAKDIDLEEDVEEIVAEPVHPAPLATRPRQICEFDLELVAERGYLTPTDTRSQLAHEMRRIKRPLLLNIRKAQADQRDEPPSNLIMITSALAQEGKTFISINLAMSLAAEFDRSVLLVDGDVPKGDISRQLGVQPERGLADLLNERDAHPEEAILRTNVDRLSLLLAGEADEHIDELFASDLMGEITLQLARHDPNRVIVFDAPPLLATTEASVLARHMGQVLVVVEANRTPQDAVVQATAQLEGCPNVSMLLNKTSRRESGSYGYGYGSGGKGGYPDRYAKRDA